MWFASFLACEPGEGPLGVNEIAAVVGVAGPRDEAGEVEDWLELLNDDAEPRSFDGWVLSGPDGDWALPPDPLAPGELVVAFCDGDVDQGPWHAPYPLPDDDFELTLSDDAGLVVQQISVPRGAEAQSFGRVPDDAPNWQVISRPSPGRRNGG